MTKNIAIGIDIGGTNTPYGIIDEDGIILAKGHLLTNSNLSVESFIEDLANHIKHKLESLPFDVSLCGIGVGAPNGDYFNGTIENAPNLPWKGRIQLADLFKEQFRDQPIFITNDANAAAVGEMIYGYARNMKDFIVVTLGTGVGSGIVSSGELVYGHKSFAGEIGHTIIEPNGRLCGCGRRGCLETYASATGFVKTAKELIENWDVRSLLKQIDPHDLKATDISQAAELGDELALKVFDITADKLGFSLANTAAITNPEAFIIQGGLARSGELLLKPLRKYMEGYLLNILQGQVKVIASALEENNTAILGAAAMVWQEGKKISI